ncbi:SH3 domain protein, partial [Cooperia oncophora]
LQFRANDRITIIERVDADWLRGQLQGREGILPSNYVSCPDIDRVPMSQLAVQTGPLEKMTAAYDYSSGVAGDLVFKAGDTIEVIAQLDEQWVRGRVNGEEAIADHCSDDPDKLYFSKGDRIIITEDVDSYWYRGKVEGFKTLPAGIFPKALVKED